MAQRRRVKKKKKNPMKKILVVFMIVLVFILGFVLFEVFSSNDEQSTENKTQEVTEVEEETIESYELNVSFKSNDIIEENGYEDEVITSESEDSQYYDISTSSDQEHDNSKLNVLITDENIDFTTTDFDLVLTSADIESSQGTNSDSNTQIILSTFEYDYLVNMQISFDGTNFEILENMVKLYTVANSTLVEVKELSTVNGDYQEQTDIYYEIEDSSVNFDYIPINPYEEITYITNDQVNDHVVINKNTCFAEDYEPEMFEYYEPAIGQTYYFDTQIESNLTSFFDDITALGYTPYVQSAYRDMYYQETIYNNYVASSSVAEADTYSARPGCSEHNTGLVVDLGVSEIPGFVLEDLDGTQAEADIHSVAAQNGFIQRYLEDKQEITQYTHESWHYRYVGVESATVIYNYGLTLEEYMQNQEYYDYLYNYEN